MFYEVFQEEAMALRKYVGHKYHAEFTADTTQLGGQDKPPAPVISIRTQSLIPDSWAKHLKGIHARSVGYEHVLQYEERNGVRLASGYLPNYCSRSVAEHALLLMMELLKKSVKQHAQFASFNRDNLTGSELLHKNLLVVGVGNIGSEVVALGRGVAMQVKGVDIVRNDKELDYVTLDQGVEWADVIVCALPNARETIGMLGYDVLKNAKPGLVLVNVSRGEVSPIRDMKQLLDEGVLAGLGLDVFEEENILGDYLRTGRGSLSDSGKIILELAHRENTVFTPHNGFNTHESVDRKARQSCEAVSEFLNKGRFPHPVPSSPW